MDISNKEQQSSKAETQKTSVPLSRQTSSLRPVLSQEPVNIREPIQEEAGVKPTPKQQVKELLPLSKRGEIETKDFRWSLLSHKGKIFKKYGITEKEVDDFVENSEEYGAYVEPRESRPLEKKLGNDKWNPNIKEKTKRK